MRLPSSLTSCLISGLMFCLVSSFSRTVGPLRPSRLAVTRPFGILRQQTLSSALPFDASNPTLEWKGSSHSTSDFVQHYLVSPEEANITIRTAVQRVLTKRREEHLECSELTADQLLDLGSIWYLPASAPRDPAKGGKPERLNASNATLNLQTGDYLRIHHNPRRFPKVHQIDWSKTLDQGGVIVQEKEEKGWLVINKPSMVPVHMTVDNAKENVAACLSAVRPPDAYVSTPQRLDQNTSGLFVVATSKLFAAYYAKLLSSKTEQQLEQNSTSDGVHKLYRCLVCVRPPDDKTREWSVGSAINELKSRQNQVIRHYLEPSIRSPKRFDSTRHNKDWLECLLKITHIGETCALIGSHPGTDLAKALWNTDSNESPRIPCECVAVVELEIELLTGRTHQIRGQLSSMGYPLVGDAQYGGAVPRNSHYYFGCEQLALQCSELEFLDPDINEKSDGTITFVQSKRWNVFRLEKAWWTPLLKAYRNAMSNVSDTEATIATSDVAISEVPSSSTRTPLKPELLPPRVSLSPGKNKYVLIRAQNPTNDKMYWFVKSATPQECGGPYHGNVAQDLREWIEAAGYLVKVTGGGRIDYDPEQKTALVYGFSYGFGKGDHARAAELINEYYKGEISASFDNTPGLY